MRFLLRRSIWAHNAPASRRPVKVAGGVAAVLWGYVSGSAIGFVGDSTAAEPYASLVAQAQTIRTHWLNAERVRVYSWITVCVFTIMMAVWVGRSLPSLVDPRGKPLGADFMAYWSTARLALAGQAASAFDWQAINPVQHAGVPFQPDLWFPWHYPPTFLLAITPLGLLPYAAALVFFLTVTSGLYAALIVRIFPDRRAWIVAAATPAALLN